MTISLSERWVFSAQATIFYNPLSHKWTRACSPFLLCRASAFWEKGNSSSCTRWTRASRTSIFVGTLERDCRNSRMASHASPKTSGLCWSHGGPWGPCWTAPSSLTRGWRGQTGSSNGRIRSWSLPENANFGPTNQWRMLRITGLDF